MESAGRVPKGKVAADLLFVLQDETLTLRALEPEGDVDFVAQAEISEVRRQRASKAELCSAGDLDSDRMVSVGQVGLVGVVLATKVCGAEMNGPTRDSLGQPLLTPTCSSANLVSEESFRFFKHPLYGCMVMLFLKEGELNQVVKNRMDKQSRGVGIVFFFLLNEKVKSSQHLSLSSCGAPPT